MKIKTDVTHKAFEAKQIKRKNVKKIAQKIGIFLVTAGLVVTMSGCSNTNRYENQNYQVMQMYQDGVLSKQSMEELNMMMAPIDEHFIDNLPSDLKILTLGYDNYIRDLSNLPTVCPTLETLVIKGCYGISNFDFIKDLSCLKSFKIYGETIGVTDELISYLDSRGIEHNLSKDLVEIDAKVETIVNSIITENMDDQEKMDTIARYVINNLKYDKSALTNNSKAAEYNESALSFALDGTGVCANYAALTSALCSKAGVSSYYVVNDNHAWNLVEIEGKYYYVDTTNISHIPVLSKFLMEKFGIGFFYMQDPYSTSFSVMSDIDEIIVPERLLQMINDAQEQKSFIEKYGSNAYVDIIAIVGVLAGLSVISRVRKNVRGY